MNEQLIREITNTVLCELNNTIPIGISARHVHLCRADMDILFGPGSQLTHYKPLMGGQFAATQKVTLVGGNGHTTLTARVLGPLRKATQVELSTTDSRALGVQAPLRDSGDIAGSGSITLIGPQGAVFLASGCITARRHIHMSPADAIKYGVADNSIVDVEVYGPKGGILSQVLVRVDESFTLEMHIDTDEANALGITQNSRARLK